MVHQKILIICFPLFLCLTLSSCVLYPLDVKYDGPEARPTTLEQYYDKGSSYTDFSEEALREEDDYIVKRITLSSQIGKSTIDYFTQNNGSTDLVLVFPVLGGRNLFSNYFAQYFVSHGFDSAIIHRNRGFRDPNNIDRLEELLRTNVVQDRIALDFFGDVYRKKQFASFGISRGAINAAMTAGVDDRLQYNVLALGGADLVSLFQYSHERGIQKFKRKVMKRNDITEEAFNDFLRKNVKTDPKYLASYIDAKNTLMFLAVFDTSVPMKYGMKLRRAIGKPDTVFLVSGHYSSVAYTQFIKVVPPVGPVCIFPLDYVETEALAFYHRSFQKKGGTLKEIPYRILQIPLYVIGTIIDTLF